MRSITRGGELADVRPAALADTSSGVTDRPGRTRCTASTAAHRTRLEPCLAWTLVSDSRCSWVSPAHEHSCAGPGNRYTSPISATKTDASVGHAGYQAVQVIDWVSLPIRSRLLDSRTHSSRGVESRGSGPVATGRKARRTLWLSSAVPAEVANTSRARADRRWPVTLRDVRM